MATVEVPEDQAWALCSLKKTASPLAAWDESDIAGNREMTFGIVCDPPRRGLVVELYMTQGRKVRRLKMNFGLWDRSGPVWERVYQLTVAPSNLPTHGEGSDIWYGSHDHLGQARRQNQLDSASFAEGLKFFCEQTNLTLEDPIEDPFKFELK
jgi:hypothetical protein